MNVHGGELLWGLSRRTYCLLGAITTLLVIGFGQSASPASAAVAPEKTDVMFIFDTSGSMGPEIEEAKASIVGVMEHTNAALPNAEYGVAEVRDYPFSEDTPGDEKGAEESVEKPWKLDQPLTSSTAAVKTAIEPLKAEAGGDAPESYGRALWETDTNPNVGWRAGARHEIVLIADNVPHDDNLDEGIPPSQWVVPEPWDTDWEGLPGLWELPGKWGIPGTVWTPGTNLDFQTIARQLGTDGKPLESVEFFGSETGYLPYWEYWAGLSGGTALNGNNGEFASKLESIVETGACSGKCEAPPHPTSTQVICSLVISTASDTCTATVSDAASTGATNPTGTVAFTSSSGGVFPSGSSCTLVKTPPSPNTSSCSVRFLPPSTPSTLPAITGAYSGDATHTASSGQTHYAAADELAAQVSFGSGTIALPDVDIPVVCWFPCAISGSLTTGPDLAKLSSVSEMTLESAALASSHGKKKNKKPKPLVLGSGKLTLGKANRSILVIKLTSKGRKALGHVGKKGVRLTLKVTVTTLNGTLVSSKSEHVTLHPQQKKHAKGKKKKK